MLLNMSPGEEILRLARKMIAEIPKGEIQSSNELKKLLERNAIIVGDDALELFGKFTGR
jgi:hypothetical protein